jgi:hypothetical protein
MTSRPPILHWLTNERELDRRSPFGIRRDHHTRRFVDYESINSDDP